MPSTHWFYDCCNLRGEIEAQAQNDLLDGLSMGQLLDRVLADRSPIVVGYSGWEGDVLMAALRRRLRRATLLRNLYWFCFKRTDADNLPSWLKDHASVRLILPPLPKFEGKKRGPEAQFTGELLSLSRERLAGEESEKEPTLPAREVFEAFIRRLNLKAPRLTTEPLEFFAEHLEKSLAADEEDEVQDLFLIRQALGRVREGSRLERESRRGAASENLADELLDRVSDALRRSDYSGALEAARRIDLVTLTADQRTSLDDALEKVYLGTSNPEDEVAACEIRILLTEACQGAKSGNSSNWISRQAKASLHLASALVNKGVALRQAGRTDEAVAAYEEVERRFGNAPEPALREPVALAKYNLSSALLTHGRFQEALAAARRAVALGSKHYNLACALARLGELDEAFSELEYCLTKGQISREHVLQDPDWEHLRDHPKFQELTKEPAG